MAFPHCDGVEDGNCKVGDLFHLNFGVCVRTFNEAGDRAVEELRRDVKKWYADMYGGADINVGHTEEDRADFTVVDLEEEEEEEEVGEYKVKVSLERLETLWVATVGLLLVCQMINCSIVFLCGYALRNLLGWSRVYSGKTFKTASDALNFDHLRLFSALLMVVAATFQFAVPFDGNTEASTGLGSKSIYLDKGAFINHMSVVTNKKNIHYLTTDNSQEYRHHNARWYCPNGDDDYKSCYWTDESFNQNPRFFGTNKMFGFTPCQVGFCLEESVTFEKTALWICLAILASFTHRIKLVMRVVGLWIQNRVEDVMLKVYSRGGEKDGCCWLMTRRFVILLITVGVPLGITMVVSQLSKYEVENIVNEGCVNGTTTINEVKGIAYHCYEYETKTGINPFLVFLQLFLILLCCTLMQSPGFRAIFGMMELLYMVIIYILCCIKILDAWAYIGNNDGGWISWEFEMYLLYYLLLPVLAVPVFILKARRIKEDVPSWMTAPWRLLRWCLCCLCGRGGKERKGTEGGGKGQEMVQLSLEGVQKQATV